MPSVFGHRHGPQPGVGERADNRSEPPGCRPIALKFSPSPPKGGKGVRGMSIRGNGACPRGERRSRSSPGRQRPIDIGRTPFMIETTRVNRKRVLQHIRSSRMSRPLGGSPRAKSRGNAQPTPLAARTLQCKTQPGASARSFSIRANALTIAFADALVCRESHDSLHCPGVCCRVAQSPWQHVGKLPRL
ncbi:MAG: hypothetical protein RLZZ436_3864 [Planctomycetota bacterium]|jgi:hypothetical protein